jgi:hypothetical protein
MKTMHKNYEGSINNPPDLETYYQDTILPEVGIKQPVVWERHVKTDPDSFLHIFTAGDVKYALAFDDYPGGFSVDQDTSVKPMQLTNGEKILHVNTENAKYIENITGAFMLFQVVNADGFEKLIKYLEVSYENLQRQWRSESRSTITIARDILQLAETASSNHDSSALHSLQNLMETFVYLDVEDNTVEIALLGDYIKILLDAEFDYEFYTPEDKKKVQAEIYKTLSREAQNTIAIQKYEAGNLEQTVRLVNAMYARHRGEMTEGIAIAIVFEGERITYPLDHFMNSELKKYFAENAYITKNNIEHHMPEMLQDYRLVKGSVLVQDIFPRELEYI